MFFVGFIPFIAGFFGEFHWVLDGFSHFRVYYGFYFLIVGIFSAISKQKWVSIINFILSVVIFLGLVQFYFPQTDIQPNEELKILSLNLLSSNNEFEEVIALITKEDPDVILLQEVNSKWDQNLNSFDEQYPYTLERIREDNFGMVVYSKLKPEEFKVVSFSEAGVPSFFFQILLNKNRVNVITTHPLPPVGSDYFTMRNDHFENLNNFLTELDEEIIVIGDLNSTNFSPNFRKIVNGTSLRDSRLGFGLQNTWNARMKLISIAIDHVLVTEGIHVSEHRTGPDIGSDHLPLITKIALK